MDAIKGLLSNKRNLMIMGGVALFIGVAVYVYLNYIRPQGFVPNDEYNQSGGAPTKEADLMLFYVTWCPHCKQAKPVWDAMKEKYNGKAINGTLVHFKSFDCDEEEQIADRYGVEGFPTIKLVRGDNDVVDFDAKPSEDTLTQFLHNVL